MLVLFGNLVSTAIIILKYYQDPEQSSRTPCTYPRDSAIKVHFLANERPSGQPLCLQALVAWTYSPHKRGSSVPQVLPPYFLPSQRSHLCWGTQLTCQCLYDLHHFLTVSHLLPSAAALCPPICCQMSKKPSVASHASLWSCTSLSWRHSTSESGHV